MDRAFQGKGRGGAVRKTRRVFFAGVVIALALVLSLGLAEGVLRVARPELGVLVENAFLENSSRIFATSRNTRQNVPHPDWKKEHTIHYNNLGLKQCREFVVPKPPGVTRIGFFGDSFTENVFMPTQYSFTEPLDFLLNRTGGRFEVLNFGTSGYAVSQVMRLARNRIRDIPGVDLVLVLPTNISRRPFLGGDGALSVDRTSNISVDPMFVLENIPAPARVTHSFHLFLFRWSALYRYTTAWTEAPRRDSGDAELRPAVRHAMLTLSQAETTALEREATARGVPVVLLQYPFPSLIPAKPGPIPSQGTDAIPADRTIDLYRPDMPDDFYQLHPAPEFLALHAWNLADELIERGFVKT